MTDLEPVHVDVAIVGAGPVGSALASGLRDSGLDVVVLEARARLQSADPRAIALSHGARLILERLNAWDELSARTTAITRIHVSQRGGFGRAELRAEDAQVPALGYVAAYGDLYAALSRALLASGAQVLTGARVEHIGATPGYAAVRYRRDDGEHLLTARLVVLSEGGSLPAHLRVDKDYGQSAVVSVVHSERAHDGRAYERFTSDGPIALLPLGTAYALVWTTPGALLEARLALDDDAFLAQLGDAFGQRQGRFTRVGARAAFPLRLALAQPARSPRVLRIGNAAHVLHPVAGQGFNLGVRDAWHLAQALLDSLREHIGTASMAATHARARRFDVDGGSLITDVLVQAFSNDHPPLRLARGAALALLDLAPPLKTLFARKMMFGARTW